MSRKSLNRNTDQELVTRKDIQLLINPPESFARRLPEFQKAIELLDFILDEEPSFRKKILRIRIYIILFWIIWGLIALFFIAYTCFPEFAGSVTPQVLEAEKQTDAISKIAFSLLFPFVVSINVCLLFTFTLIGENILTKSLFQECIRIINKLLLTIYRREIAIQPHLLENALMEAMRASDVYYNPPVDAKNYFFSPSRPSLSPLSSPPRTINNKNNESIRDRYSPSRYIAQQQNKNGANIENSEKFNDEQNSNEAQKVVNSITRVPEDTFVPNPGPLSVRIQHDEVLWVEFLREVVQVVEKELARVTGRICCIHGVINDEIRDDAGDISSSSVQDLEEISNRQQQQQHDSVESLSLAQPLIGEKRKVKEYLVEETGGVVEEDYLNNSDLVAKIEVFGKTFPASSVSIIKPPVLYNLVATHIQTRLTKAFSFIQMVLHGINVACCLLAASLLCMTFQAGYFPVVEFIVSCLSLVVFIIHFSILERRTVECESQVLLPVLVGVLSVVYAEIRNASIWQWHNSVTPFFAKHCGSLSEVGGSKVEEYQKLYREFKLERSRELQQQQRQQLTAEHTEEELNLMRELGAFVGENDSEAQSNLKQFISNYKDLRKADENQKDQQSVMYDDQQKPNGPVGSSWWSWIVPWGMDQSLDAGVREEEQPLIQRVELQEQHDQPEYVQEAIKMVGEIEIVDDTMDIRH